MKKMTTYYLTLSKVFPVTHPKAGQDTGFKQKLFAAKLGVPQNETPPVVASATVTLPSHKEATTPAASPTGKRKRSTGTITYNDSIQTSLFE